MNTDYSVSVEILSAIGGAVDIGTFIFADSLIKAGVVKVFSVTPQDFGVG